ncbi:bifunctional oligoribonuclease/PAP phosphatase NrnA [Rapidithrix thailandica]|uniref:Bifunctional oligoribonuclease/PAP phosphatase NrnA n=1 Tax=Rapidithrix thailandica TaxID=413964 RepID=A0AAW9SDS0_9BACT
MTNYTALKEFLSNPKKIIILPHRKPDADALGSCLALSAYLRKAGHTTTVISPTDYPKFLFWMPGQKEVLIYENGKQNKAKKLIEEADLAFCLDFNELSRIEQLGELVAKAKLKKAVIDHHQGNIDFADYYLHDPKAAATAELVYDFIQLDGGSQHLDKKIAECIYAGIMTDTGSFKFPSTSSKIHRIIADLMDLGINASRIHRLVYDTSTENRLRFLGYALHQNLTFLPEFKTGYFALSKKELKEYKTETGDTEGLVNYALSVKGIRLAALFSEKEGFTKISFRSVGDFSVAKLAAEHFNGGGHVNAAGGIYYKSLQETVDTFVKILEQYKEELHKSSE